MIEIRNENRDGLTFGLIGMMTKILIDDLNAGLSSFINDKEIEGLLIDAMKNLPVGKALCVCFAPFVRKLVKPTLDNLSIDDLTALSDQWGKKFQGEL